MATYLTMRLVITWPASFEHTKLAVLGLLSADWLHARPELRPLIHSDFGGSSEHLGYLNEVSTSFISKICQQRLH